MGTRRPEADIWWGGMEWVGHSEKQTVLALTNSETLTWFVSEPDFRFSRFFDLRNILGKYVGVISRNN